MELALVAFDGLDPRVIERKRDELSTFDRLLDNSMWGSWKTPGHTIPSFISTLTGRQYNITNFHWDEGKGQFQRHRQTNFEFIWDICDSSMTLLNMPVLYPPENIDDCMVCGFLTPDDLTTSNIAKPNEVQDLLNKVNYTPDIHADRTYGELGGEGMKKYLKDIMLDRVDVAENLINMFDSDLFYGVWTSTDRWFHQCHLHDEEFMPLYHHADKTLEKMVSIIPDDIPLIVFSDHGFAHFSNDEGVHKGHMYDGFYSIRYDGLPNYRDDSASIFDLFPTIVNYLEGDAPDTVKGRILFHTGDQDNQVRDRLDSLGYLE